MTDALLTPISEDAPCGEYLKGNRTFYRGLRNCFNMAQSSFRQLLETPDALNDEELIKNNQQNWLTLAEQCEDCLQHTSKDIEVFCWLATARLYTNDPLAKLAEALTLFDTLVATYWDHLHPMAPVEKLKSDDEAGQKKEWAEGRLRPLLQLVGDTADSGLLFMPLQLTELIAGITYSQYFSAEKSGSLSAMKDQAVAALANEKATVIERIESLGQIQTALADVEQKISERCIVAGTSGVSFRFVKENVERLLNALRYLIGESLGHWPLDPIIEPPEETAADLAEENNDEPGDAATVPTSTAFASTQALANRDQAFNELRKIADFFRATEPHSPIYMLLERAIRWGYLPLPELLNEMVGDNPNVMSRITTMAGLESIERTAIPVVPQTIPVIQTSAPVEPVTQSTETKTTTESSPTQRSSGLSNIEW